MNLEIEFIIKHPLRSLATPFILPWPLPVSCSQTLLVLLNKPLTDYIYQRHDAVVYRHPKHFQPCRQRYSISRTARFLWSWRNAVLNNRRVLLLWQQDMVRHLQYESRIRDATVSKSPIAFSGQKEQFVKRRHPNFKSNDSHWSCRLYSITSLIFRGHRYFLDVVLVESLLIAKK